MRVILALIAFTMLFGCIDGGKKPSYLYVVKNETDHLLQIELFESGAIQKTFSSLGKGNIIEAKKLFGSGEDHTAWGALGCDSVVITFDNKKRQIYTYGIRRSYQFGSTPENSARNILDNISYAKNGTIYTFSFIEADYEKAIEF
jgi:hypothetical protein